MSDSDLVCDVCGKGPFKGLVGLRAHQSSHRGQVECRVCGRRVAAQGLGPHLRGHRNAGERATGAAELSRLARQLHALMPEAGEQLVERLAAFVAQHEPRPQIWAVITVDDGPWLCRESGVGVVAARAKAPIVAVPLDLVYEHLNRTATAGNGSSTFHAGASWPHPRGAR